MKRRIRATHILLAAALAAPALLLAPQTAQAAQTTQNATTAQATPTTQAGWTLETVPSPSGIAAPDFSGVSCPTATACIGVGTSMDSTGTGTGSFAEDWNGTSWTAKTVAAPHTTHLDAVSCSSATACTAVGSKAAPGQDAKPQAERWNGTNWTVQSVPAIDGSLPSVSCPTATTCVAVGSHGSASPIAETWNGTKWTQQDPPVPTGTRLDTLSAVSCRSATSCIAVGVESTPDGPPYSDSWNGKSWTPRPVPLPAGGVQGELNAVSCGASTCQAVGYYTDNGGTTYAALADRWNGAGWTAEPTASLGGSWSGTLDGVSCAQAGPCSAVGSKSDATFQTVLDEYWNGTKWLAHPVLTPPGAQYKRLTAVSCVTGTNCQLVGNYETRAGFSLLAEQGS